MKACLEEFGGKGPPLHFAHANGFPPTAYGRFLRPFTRHFRVTAMRSRPLWEGSLPETLQDWEELADDLLVHLSKEQEAPMIGMGHSLGAVVTMLAAAKRPGLFRALVLLEPVFLPPLLLSLIRAMPTCLVNRIHPLIPKTLRRKTEWDSKQDVLDSFRQKQVFSRISEEGLVDLVEAVVTPRESGTVGLVYPREWEARIYALPPRVWSPLRSISIPVVGLRGAMTDTLLPRAWKHWNQIRPQDRLLEVPDATHLLPLEQPERTAQRVLAALQSIDAGAIVR